MIRRSFARHVPCMLIVAAVILIIRGACMISARQWLVVAVSSLLMWPIGALLDGHERQRQRRIGARFVHRDDATKRRSDV